MSATTIPAMTATLPRSPRIDEGASVALARSTRAERGAAMPSRPGAHGSPVLASDADAAALAP